MVRASCRGGGELPVEGGFKNRIGEESPGIGDEASGFAEGEQARGVAMGAIEEERKAAVV